MEPIYSEWKPWIDAHNRKMKFNCPFCQSTGVAETMIRRVTNRDGERSEQYRVECQLCKEKGKTYLNKNVAEQSWISGETKSPEPKPKRRSGGYE